MVKPSANGQWSATRRGSVPGLTRRRWSVIDEASHVYDWSTVNITAAFQPGTIGKLYKVEFKSHCKDEKMNALGGTFGIELDAIEERLVPRGLLMRRLDINVISLSRHAELSERAKLLHELRHDHLLPLLAVLTDGPDRWGELMPAQKLSFKMLLDRAGKHAETAQIFRTVWLRLLSDAVSAVSFLHERDIAHLSLHPNNMLLDAQMSLKLSDYGRSFPVLEHQLKHADRSAPSNDDPPWVYLPPETLSNRVSRSSRMPNAVVASDETTTTTTSARGANAITLQLDHVPTVRWAPTVDVWAIGCLIARASSLNPLYDYGVTSQDSTSLFKAIAQGKVSLADNFRQFCKDLSSSARSSARCDAGCA